MVSSQRGTFWRFIIFLLIFAGLLSYVASRRDFARRVIADLGRSQARSSTGSVMEVGKPATGTEGGYFLESRLDRDRTRGEQLELLRQIVNNPNSDQGARQEANRRLIKLSESMGKELEVENLIKVKGFEDALVFLGEGTATVIVKAQSLAAPEVARIADVVTMATGLPAAKISILSKP